MNWDMGRLLGQLRRRAARGLGAIVLALHRRFRRVGGRTVEHRVPCVAESRQRTVEHTGRAYAGVEVDLGQVLDMGRGAAGQR